jgi:hypothetical protein
MATRNLFSGVFDPKFLQFGALVDEEDITSCSGAIINSFLVQTFQFCDLKTMQN